METAVIHSGRHVKGEAGDVEKARKCKETSREGGEASREGKGCLTELMTEIHD